jgi:hypothetical protein
MLGGTVGLALCGTLLLATGDNQSLFLMTGVLIFATLLCAWLTVEALRLANRRAQSADPCRKPCPMTDLDPTEDVHRALRSAKSYRLTRAGR